jgi:hypothetical protein
MKEPPAADSDPAALAADGVEIDSGSCVGDMVAKPTMEVTARNP